MSKTEIKTLIEDYYTLADILVTLNPDDDFETRTRIEWVKRSLGRLTLRLNITTVPNSLPNDEWQKKAAQSHEKITNAAHEWICDVLLDMAAYARSNGLSQELEFAIQQAHQSVLQELTHVS